MISFPSESGLACNNNTHSYATVWQWQTVMTIIGISTQCACCGENGFNMRWIQNSNQSEVLIWKEMEKRGKEEREIERERENERE